MTKKEETDLVLIKKILHFPNRVSVDNYSLMYFKGSLYFNSCSLESYMKQLYVMIDSLRYL